MLVGLKVRSIRCYIVLFFLVLISTSTIQSKLSLTNPLEYHNSSLYSEGRAVELVDNIAYCGMKSGLQIVDFTNPTNPTLLSNLYLTKGPIRDLKVVGNKAFVSQSQGFFYIVDISDLTSPFIVSEYQLPSNGMGLDVVGNVAFVCFGDYSNNNGLVILDISNPVAISEISTISSDEVVYNVKAIDDYLYFVNGKTNIYNISDLYNPAFISDYSSSDLAFNIQVVDSLLYVLDLYPIVYEDYQAKFTILNASDKNSIKPLGSTTYLTNPFDFNILNDKAYIGSNNLYQIDITDKTNPSVSSTYYINGNSCSINLENNNLIYIDNSQYYHPTNKTGDLYYLDVTNPVNIEFVTKLENPEPISYFTGDNNYLFALNKETFGDRIYITAIGEESIISTYNTTNDPLTAEVVDSLLLVGTTSGLEILNISDPTNIISKKIINTNCAINDLVVINNYAYAAAGDGGLIVFDIFDGSNYPKAIVDEAGYFLEIANYGDKLYLTNNGNTPSIYNISNPTAPTFIGRVGTDKFTDIQIGDNYLFLQDLRKIEIYDLTNSVNPTLIKTFSDSIMTESGYSRIYFSDMFYYENNLAITNDGAGFSILNVSDPTNPVISNRYSTTGVASNIAVINNLLIVNDQNSIIYYSNDVVSDIEDNPSNLPEKYSLYQNYPNPFNPSTTISYELPRRSDVKIEIYNILGQKVATLVNESQEAGFHSLEWDGSKVSSGIYLYRFVTPEKEVTKKMVLIK